MAKNISPTEPGSMTSEYADGLPSPAEPDAALTPQALQTCSAEMLAQALAQKLAIPGLDWHRLNRDRTVRAQEQTAAALVYLLKGHPEEALPRLTQAVGWLDKTLTAPPCPTHAEKKARSQ